MSEADFNIDSLASYLHLMPQQVSRLADRGKVPGRKVSGEWRFSRAEIHHWLEERIGTSDCDIELAEMEGVLQRHADPEQTEVTIAEMLSMNAIAIPLASKTRDSTIHAMVNLAHDTGHLWDPERMADAVRARENMHPTALSCGVALMHPRRPMSDILAEPILALGRTVQGIPFGGQGGQLTDLFFLICSTSDQTHLRTLARISRLINDSEVLSAIRSAEDAQQTYDILVQRETDLNT
ncbi:MAG: PTS sugar transporter subunit IIA [Planctomycetales bacterium]